MGRHKARRTRSGRHPVYTTIRDQRQVVKCRSRGGTVKQRIGSEDEAKAEAAYQWALYRRSVELDSGVVVARIPAVRNVRYGWSESHTSALFYRLV